jgi:recombination protein RecR
MQGIETIQKLTVQLGRLHGIGQKTANRLAYHILDMPAEQARELAEAILEAKERIHFCPVCGAYTEEDPCPICADPARTAKTLCVVGEPRDVTAMEKTREFKGKYHVLHGLLSPMDGIGPENLRIRELMERVEKDGTEEVILATNPDVEGEATAAYIAGLLRPRKIVCTRLAHGIPIGGNLEYTDEVTLAKALEGRRTI